MKKVSIVDDDPAVRASIRLMVEQVRGFRVISVHSCGDTALRELPGERPDLVFMDIRLPGKSGIVCARELKDRAPAIRVVILTAHLTDGLVADAFQAGAVGYVVKPATLDEIRAALEFGSRGDIHLRGPVSERFSTWMKSRQPGSGVILTPRETRILDLVRQGYSDREIAGELNIAESTAKTHLRNILLKLKARSRAHAVGIYYGRR